MLKGLNFIIRHVDDVAATRDFYVQKLGLAVEEAAPGFVQFAGSGGATFALGDAGAGDPLELWWFVDDADATHRELQSRGVEIVAPPSEMPFGRTLAIRDCDGNPLHLLQPRARA